MTMIVKKIGCIQLYRKSIVSNGFRYSLCEILTQYESIFRYVSNVEMSTKLFTASCKEIVVETNIMERKGRMRVDTWSENNDTRSRKVSYLALGFIQGREMFQEIDNARDFKLERCRSSMCGFVGIFVGYSLIHCTNFLSM